MGRNFLFFFRVGNCSIREDTEISQSSFKIRTYSAHQSPEYPESKFLSFINQSISGGHVPPPELLHFPEQRSCHSSLSRVTVHSALKTRCQFLRAVEHFVFEH